MGARTLSVTFLVALVTLVVASAARADVGVLGFDDQAAGTVVQDQYRNVGGADHGAVFGTSPSQTRDGAIPVVTAVGSLAHSGNRVGKLSKGPCPNGECPGGPFGFVFFPFPKSFVTMFVGAFGTAKDTITVKAFSSTGTVIGMQQAQVTGGTAFSTPVGFPTGPIPIAYVEVQGSTFAAIGVDDITFAQSNAPPPPSFGLRGGAHLVVAQSGSTQTFLTLTRQNGSSGSIGLSASAPANVHVSFAPAAATRPDGDRIAMTVTADASAPPVTGALLTVTARPSGAQAGAVVQTAQYTLDVLASFQADPRVTGMEVTQGSQFNANIRDPQNPDAPVQYGGVLLDSFHKTVARVYADNSLATPPGGVPDADMRLYGFDVNTGKPLPGSPLLPDNRFLTLHRTNGNPNTTGQRADPAGAFDFTLPDAWTGGTPAYQIAHNTINFNTVLAAVLVPPRDTSTLRICSSPACLANDRFTVFNVYYDADLPPERRADPSRSRRGACPTRRLPRTRSSPTRFTSPRRSCISSPTAARSTSPTSSGGPRARPPEGRMPRTGCTTGRRTTRSRATSSSA